MWLLGIRTVGRAASNEGLTPVSVTPASSRVLRPVERSEHDGPSRADGGWGVVSLRRLARIGWFVSRWRICTARIHEQVLEEVDGLVGAHPRKDVEGFG